MVVISVGDDDRRGIGDGHGIQVEESEKAAVSCQGSAGRAELRRAASGGIGSARYVQGRAIHQSDGAGALLRTSAANTERGRSDESVGEEIELLDAGLGSSALGAAA